MGRSEKLRADLAVAEAEDRLVKLKSKRSVCSECGRIKPAKDADEKAIRKAKAELRKIRQSFREKHRA